jgi:hypothetical protein
VQIGAAHPGATDVDQHVERPADHWLRHLFDDRTLSYSCSRTASIINSSSSAVVPIVDPLVAGVNGPDFTQAE